VLSQSGFVSKLVVIVLDTGEIFFAMKQFFYLYRVWETLFHAF
jgi:hypothetical protein